jgi:hypothetical protein
MNIRVTRGRRLAHQRSCLEELKISDAAAQQQRCSGDSATACLRLRIPELRKEWSGCRHKSQSSSPRGCVQLQQAPNLHTSQQFQKGV